MREKWVDCLLTVEVRKEAVIRSRREVKGMERCKVI